MIKAIIFDIGGIFSKQGGTELLRKRYARTLGVSLLKFNKLWARYWDSWRKGKIDEETFWKSILHALNVDYDKKKLRRMMLDYQKIDIKRLSLASRLRKKYKVVALTNHVKEWFEFIRKRYKIDNYFDDVFTSYDIGMAKPNPKIYNFIIKKMNVNANECVFVDDKLSNVLGARMIGMKAIHFKNFLQMKRDLKKQGVEIE